MADSLPPIPDAAVPMTQAQAGEFEPSWVAGWNSRADEQGGWLPPGPSRPDGFWLAHAAGWCALDILSWGREHDRSFRDGAPRSRDKVDDPAEWDAGFAERIAQRCPSDSQRDHEAAIARGESPPLRTNSNQSGWWAADRIIYRRTLEMHGDLIREAA